MRGFVGRGISKGIDSPGLEWRELGVCGAGDFNEHQCESSLVNREERERRLGLRDRLRPDQVRP